MKNRTRALSLIAVVVCLSVSAAAQFGGPPRIPGMRGVWAPVVGAGSAYQMEGGRMGKMQIEYAVVGTEAVAGKPGHWLEMTTKGDQGLMVMKTLMVADGATMQSKRMIMQQGDDEPMEFPMEMMARMGGGGGGPREQVTDIRKDAEVVGTEEITVPAGKFTCTHLKTKDGADVWVSDKVAPYGLVKMTSKEANMTLLKVMTDAKTKIRGTPRVFDPAEMMRQRP